MDPLKSVDVGIRIFITISALPNLSSCIAPTGLDVIISDSSFFKHHSSLPSLEEVRRQALSKPHPKKENVAIFENLNLLVKFGIKESIAEGQCLYTVRRAFGPSVPVPEVSMGRYERRRTTQRDSRASQDFSYTSGGETEFGKSVRHICHTPLQDIALPTGVLPNAGPFPSVKEFHDWFSFLYRRWLADPNAYPQDPYRRDLPDDARIVLTHGDLHRSNIMVTKSGPPRILALIDWHQAGWLPEYWEVCKAIYTVGTEDEWAQKYIPQFLQRSEEIEVAWDFYVLATGN
ncbi:hypothetical protein OPT61_g1716 [Boeremia exigua]|uniref:Uncharacterized protein n=1 Tax=Boeremia exigua TaxID=749465 RepID=A0ACC2IPC0_9PLEO|nr:hypothetical protein OPT61_g1716 [Boeremia exigua]